MVIDLNPLPFRLALDILEFCVDRGIDLDRCARLLELWHQSRVQHTTNQDWIIDIPEKYLSWFILKYHV